MAKPHCDKHKRFVPYCDDCKAIVKAAEEREALEEHLEAESNALKEEVGFPVATEPVEVPETGEPVEGDRGEEQPAFTGDGVHTAPAPDADIDETEAAMTEAGEFDIPPQPPLEEPLLNSEVQTEIAEIIKALEAAEPVTVLIGEGAEESLRNEGRREVVRWVRDYFADSIDTVTFQLLAYLAKKCSGA